MTTETWDRDEIFGLYYKIDTKFYEFSFDHNRHV